MKTAAGQRGAALLIALVLMAAITLLASSALRFSVVGLRVAVSEELRSDAFQRAQSLTDMALAVPLNLMIAGALDETNCVAGVSGCTRNTLQLYFTSGSPVTSADLYANGDSIRVRRIGPEVSTPPRNTGYSAVRFQASYLQVESGYDGIDSGWGRAELNEGVTVIVPMLGG